MTSTVTPQSSPVSTSGVGSDALTARLKANSAIAAGKYRDYGVRLAPEHASALLKDEKVVLGPDQLSGGHILRLTPRQIAKFEKAKSTGKGVTLGKLSASQWKQNMGEGAFYGDVWAAAQKAAAAADKRHAKAIKQQGPRAPVKQQARAKKPVAVQAPVVSAPKPRQPREPKAQSVKAPRSAKAPATAKPSAPRRAIAAKLQGARAKKAAVV
jgi:hypothetical protein